MGNELQKQHYKKALITEELEMEIKNPETKPIK
jgi:hypothetical protein